MQLTIRIQVTLAIFMLLVVAPSWSQDSQLKGTVRDAANNQGIPGTDVSVEDSHRTVVGHSITNADGEYVVTGLKRGSNVNAYYSRGGYVPHPRGPEAVLLSNASNTKDVQLLKDTQETAYWTEWSGKVQTAVDRSTPDKAQRFGQYEKIWLWLGTTGLSAQAQGQAARGFVNRAPEVLRSTEINDFASADLNSLEKADADIRAAITGNGTISNTYSLPPDVAASIAANELYKSGKTDPTTLQRFSNEFKRVWGTAGQQALQERLSQTRPTWDVMDSIGILKGETNM